MHDIDQPSYPIKTQERNVSDDAPVSSYRKTRKFLCSYFHDGGWWSLMIDAYDMKDAEKRVDKLGNLRLDGEHIVTIPVPNAASIFSFATPFFGLMLIVCALADAPLSARVILGVLFFLSLAGFRLYKK
jgi:hypothetical protein